MVLRACYMCQMHVFKIICILFLLMLTAHGADPVPTSQVALLQQKVKDEPGNALYWNDLGAAYGRHSEWKNAVNALKKAVSIKKDYAHAWYNLGFAYENANVLSKAVEAYKQAVHFQDKFPEAWLSLGVVYQRQGKLDDARKILPTLEQQDGRMAKELTKLIESTPQPVKKK